MAIFSGSRRVSLVIDIFCCRRCHREGREKKFLTTEPNIQGKFRQKPESELALRGIATGICSPASEQAANIRLDRVAGGGWGEKSRRQRK